MATVDIALRMVHNRAPAIRRLGSRILPILPAQCRAARAMVEMDQARLAQLANVSRNTIVDFEKGKRTPGPNNLDAIQRALETAGVAFTNGRHPGVKMMTAYTVEEQIAHHSPKAAALIPKKASPEKGMAMLRRGKAELRLKGLKGRKGGPIKPAKKP